MAAVHRRVPPEVGRTPAAGGGAKARHRADATNCSPSSNGKIAKWWTPDDVVFVDAIRLGATGKMLKNRLREQFKDHKLPTA